MCFKSHLITSEPENGSEIKGHSVKFTFFFTDEDMAGWRDAGTCPNHTASSERLLGHSPLYHMLCDTPGSFQGTPQPSAL